jgi:hypothetical protein
VETLLNYGIGIQKIDDRTHGYFVWDCS